jgi:glycosyltransferase involved in cell wall biosynthesis
MRIVIYYPRAAVGDGGMSRAVRRLARELAAEGADVAMVFDERGGPKRHDAVCWRHLSHAGAGWFRVPVGLRDVLAGADVLLLESGWVLHNVRAAAAARRAGVPYVVGPRGAYDRQLLRRRAAMKRAWWAVAERDLVARARATHVFFGSEIAHLRALECRGPTIVAPNGVDPPVGYAWDGGTGGSVLWIGRFDAEHKGLDLLLRAVAEADPDEVPPLRLHGPDWRGMKEVVRRAVEVMGLRDRVSVGEPLYGPAKLAALASASAFVYPSRWEAFGNSPAEAVAMGVPTVMTPYPLARVLAERGGAFLATATRESLAGALRRATSAEGARVGAAGARVIRAEFSWREVARSWLEQLERVL